MVARMPYDVYIGIRAVLLRKGRAMAKGLTEFEQRGDIEISSRNIFGVTSGWFKLQTDQYGHDVVAMRKVGGRNWFMLCLVSSVESFTPYKKAGK